MNIPSFGLKGLLSSVFSGRASGLLRSAFGGGLRSGFSAAANGLGTVGRTVVNKPFKTLVGLPAASLLSAFLVVSGGQGVAQTGKQQGALMRAKGGDPSSLLTQKNLTETIPSSLLKNTAFNMGRNWWLIKYNLGQGQEHEAVKELRLQMLLEMFRQMQGGAAPVPPGGSVLPPPSSEPDPSPKKQKLSPGTLIAKNTLEA